MGCVSPQALLSALVHRARGGRAPTRADIEAVLAAGCTADDVVTMLDRVGGETAALARAVVADKTSATR